MLLGLGFTFFSGATEAWLVDALRATHYQGTLEGAFAKGQIAEGIAMLTGTVAGGVIAQATNLGVPYVLRALILGLTFLVAFMLMHDVGFTPEKRASVLKKTRSILKSSLDHGLRNPPVRWLMLAAPFSAGVGLYAFYAMQPYLLELYGRSDAYAIAGLAAAIVAGAQIVGGLIVPHLGKAFRRRTSLLLAGSLTSAGALALIGLMAGFWLALALLAIWAIVFAASMPIRQAYINALIPSEERATVLSFDNLLSSAGGAVVQPALGKVADVWSYPSSYLAGAAIELLALPFILLARRENAPSDPMSEETVEPAVP
jgi:MFS family permease